jgi:hypothetical protein
MGACAQGLAWWMCCTGIVIEDELKANAILRGGPDPIGGRHVVAAPGAAEVRALAANGSGAHVWRRTGRFEPRPNGGVLRVFVCAAPAE